MGRAAGSAGGHRRAWAGNVIHGARQRCGDPKVPGARVRRAQPRATGTKGTASKSRQDLTDSAVERLGPTIVDPALRPGRRWATIRARTTGQVRTGSGLGADPAMRTAPGSRRRPDRSRAGPRRAAEVAAGTDVAPRRRRGLGFAFRVRPSSLRMLLGTLLLVAATARCPWPPPSPSVHAAADAAAYGGRLIVVWKTVPPSSLRVAGVASTRATARFNRTVVVTRPGRAVAVAASASEGRTGRGRPGRQGPGQRLADRRQRTQRPVCARQTDLAQVRAPGGVDDHDR